MENIVTIIPRVNIHGNIILEITQDQFEDINRALKAFNKKRDVHRNTAAKKRGSNKTRTCKAKLVFSYPVADIPTIIQQNTTENLLPFTNLKPRAPTIMPQTAPILIPSINTIMPHKQLQLVINPPTITPLKTN